MASYKSDAIIESYLKQLAIFQVKIVVAWNARWHGIRMYAPASFIQNHAIIIRFTSILLLKKIQTVISHSYTHTHTRTHTSIEKVLVERGYRWTGVSVVCSWAWNSAFHFHSDSINRGHRNEACIAFAL